MRAVIAGAGILALAACSETPQKQASGPKLVQPDCRTVEPFKPLKVAKPETSVPDIFRAFLGSWTGGAWDGYICHDLVVLKVDEEGHVEMFDAHGPGFGYDATGFTRQGEIGDDGKLRVRKGHAMVEYWIEDGRLYGVRDDGKHRSKIILSRES